MEEQTPDAIRSQCAKPMRFQARDDEILKTIYDVGGVVAKRQLKEMFWPDKSWRAMEQRLSKLYHDGYLDWPSQDQRRQHMVPEPVCWLGWRGATHLAQSRELRVDPIEVVNENQLGTLEGALRKQGFRWMREPRWIQLAHDLAVVDFRLHLERSLRELPSLALSEWLHEGIFRSKTDVVEYEVDGKSGPVRKARRGVIPDAYFVIEDEQRKARGQPYRARFLLEMDNATHDNPSFGLEKALPGAAYIGSAPYRKRFGQNSCRWLVVTTAGEKRMENLIRQTEQRVEKNANLFYFTTLGQIKAQDTLMASIWLQAGSRRLSSLLA